MSLFAMRDTARTAFQHSLRTAARRAAAAASLLALMLAAQPGFAHDFSSGNIVVDHPSARATPAGARVAAGYAAIRNTGPDADRLVAAAGEIAGRTEIHEMSVDGAGVMTMRPVTAGIAIPAGGTVELKPGGLHIMFMELNRGAREGERFKGSLTFEKAGRIDVEFVVERPASEHGEHSHGG